MIDMNIARIKETHGSKYKIPRPLQSTKVSHFKMCAYYSQLPTTHTIIN